MNRIIFFILASCICFSSFSQKKLKYSKAKITYNSSLNYKKLVDAGITMDHGTHKRGVFIISDFSSKEIETAKKLGAKVDILIDDTELDFIKRNKAAQHKTSNNNPSCSETNNINNYPTPTNFSLGSMGGYLTYQEMLNNLDAMRAQYPSLITARANIGNFITQGTADNSVTPSIGGNALQWVRISNNPDMDQNKPEILYDAIHHAREPAGLSQLIYYMWYLLENYNTNDEVKQIVDNTELYFVPVVNPDGYLYNQATNPNGGGMWRKNRFNTHGVDLNRNYDHYVDGTSNTSIWGGLGTSPDVNNDTYPGTSAFSEVESQAMKWFTEQHNFSIALNNHTFGDLLLYPFGYDNNKPTPEDDIFISISQQMVDQNGFNNIIASGLYPAAGDSDDYMYGGTTQPHNRIFAFTPEIGDAFWPASNEIEGICKNTMHMNLTAAKMVNNYATVEDTNPEFIGNNTSFEATYNLKRLGLSGNGNFTVSITPISNNISSVGSPKTYTNTQIETIINDNITINLDNNIQVGDEITYTYNIDGGEIIESVTISKKFGAFISIVVDNDASNLSAFTNNGWGTTTATFVSSSASITESPSGNYSPNENKTLMYSQDIDLSNFTFASMEFYAKWDIENNWDYVQFEVSTDGGVIWTPQCGKYTNPGASNSNQPEGQPVYDGTQTEWVLENINLNEYLGQTIKVRFQFSSDSSSEADGFYFDDLKVRGVDEPLLNTNDLDNTNFIIFPNPTSDNIRIQPSLSDKMFDIEIRNIMGQVIVSQKNVTNIYEYNLSQYNTGIYFLTISEENNFNTFKIIKH